MNSITINSIQLHQTKSPMRIEYIKIHASSTEKNIKNMRGEGYKW